MEMSIQEISIIKLVAQLVVLLQGQAVDKVLLVKIKTKELDILKYIQIHLQVLHWIWNYNVQEEMQILENHFVLFLNILS